MYKYFPLIAQDFRPFKRSLCLRSFQLYSVSLTLFSSFTDICCLSELDSLLLFANYNSDFFLFRPHGVFLTAFLVLVVYVPYSFRSRGHCTSSLFSFILYSPFYRYFSSLELTVQSYEYQCIYPL